MLINIFYTGIGSNGKKYFNENEFLNIIKTNFEDYYMYYKDFKLKDWINWSGAELM